MEYKVIGTYVVWSYKVCSECLSSHMHSMQRSRAIQDVSATRAFINSRQTATVVAFPPDCFTPQCLATLISHTLHTSSNNVYIICSVYRTLPQRGIPKKGASVVTASTKMRSNNVYIICSVYRTLPQRGIPKKGASVATASTKMRGCC